MERVTLIRYAEEGFINYPQQHLQALNGPVEGCYAFIEEELEELLRYTLEYHQLFPEIKNRSSEKKVSLIVSGEVLVWVKNKQIVSNFNDIYINEDKTFVMIAEEPIIKNKVVGGMEFPLSADIYVQIPVSIAAQRYNKIKDIYQWLRCEKRIPEDASVNTNVIDYCECIIDVNKIKIV